MKFLSSITSAVILLCVYCFTRTEGLDCYVCAHADGDTDIKGFVEDGIKALNLNLTVHKSCKSGKNPSELLIRSCDGLQYGDNAACGKAHVKYGKNKITLRACIPKTAFEDTCAEGTIEELAEKYGSEFNIPPELRNLDASASICSCYDDECNSSSMLKVTQFLWMLLLPCLASKFAWFL